MTLYGVADLGFGKFHKQKAGMVSGHALNNSDSFIGFRGIEDLGGGLKAGFQLEQTINMKTGENNNQTPRRFKRLCPQCKCLD